MHRIKKKIKKVLDGFRQSYLYKIIWSFCRSKLPKNSDGKILIHIGCGELNDRHYINVDTRPMPHIHFVGSVLDIDKFFPKNYADLIYICHILEHISHQKLPLALKKLYKCLKADGILRVSVPDFDTLIKIYQEEGTIESIINPLMGGQGYEGNFHCSIFNKDYLSKLFKKIGFREVREWDAFNASYHNFKDWSRKKYRLEDKEWFISLNLEAIK